MNDLIRRLSDLSDLTELQWDEIRANYLGMCAKIDDQFSRICYSLKQKGIYDDSIIVFLSDHGDYCGDYDLVEKAQSDFPDCLIKVPLLIKPPKWEKIKTGISDAMTELVDFYATVLDYADIAASHTHFGRSLRPVIEGTSPENRTYVCCEGGRLAEERHCDEYHSLSTCEPDRNNAYWPKMMAQTDDEAHAKATMIRSKDHKYISRYTGEDELYDLRSDPSETKNIIGDKNYTDIVNGMRLELLRWYQRTSDIVPFELDRRFTDEMLWNKVKKKCSEGMEAEVKEKIREGMDIVSLNSYLSKIRT